MLSAQIIQGDCLDVMRGMNAGSVDAIVTDPPAGIAFMGKAWDGDKGGRRQWIAWLTDRMAEGLRVLKPGGYTFVWALPRTSHWTATALEDAGFEIRDVVHHVFGQGFPKSKALLKPAAENWILCRKPGSLRHLHIDACRIHSGPSQGGSIGNGIAASLMNDDGWQGHGPRPIDRSMPAGRWPANFVMSHSPPTFDADGNQTSSGCERVGTKRVKAHSNGESYSKPGTHVYEGGFRGDVAAFHYASPDGTEEVAAWRCVEGCPIRLLDEQSGVRTSGSKLPHHRRTTPKGKNTICSGIGGGLMHAPEGGENFPGDTGTASRFFHCFEADPFIYQAKASKKDRGEENGHPTVKSRYLMAHLCRLIAAPGETVLDLFAGSGSTGVACAAEGMHFLGIELEAESVETARRRCGLQPAPLEMAS